MFSRTHRFARSSLAAATSLGLVVALSLPALASGAAIALSPNVGPPTTSVKVTGSGFGPREKVDLTFSGTLVGTPITGSRGGFKTQISVPATATPGRHTVKATGRSSGRSSTRTFLVQTNWSRFRFGNAHTGYNPYENVLSASNVSGMVLDWSYPIGDLIFSSAAVANGVVYVGSQDGKVYAFDASTGAVLWSYETGDRVTSSPAVANGVVYVGSQDGKVYAFGL